MRNLFLLAILCLFFCAPVWLQVVTEAQTLPPVAAADTVVAPAVAEVTYDSWFLKTFVMRSDNDTCKIDMFFVRYSYAAKKTSTDPADVMRVTIPNAYERVAGFTQWQTAMSAFMGLASGVATEQEILDKIAAVDQQIETAKQAEPEVDVTALEAQRVTLEGSLAIAIEAMGPISP